LRRRKAKKPYQKKTRIFRSGLEARVSSELGISGVEFTYEPKDIWIPYQKPPSKYKPDFVLSNGIIIETKGLFDSADRTKHKLIKNQNPNLDIRFVFSNSRNRISKKSKTTYAMWCEKNKFLYADHSVPSSWIKEEKNLLRINALRKHK